MANAFNKGDLVILKSGGPPMTIEETPKSGSEKYFCRWFKGATPAQGVFSEHVLKLYTSPTEKQ